jgi:hypothetical protein
MTKRSVVLRGLCAAALWTVGCYLGAADVPLGYLPLFVTPWVLRSKREARAELHRKLGKADYILLGALAVVVASLAVAARMIPPDQVAASEIYRAPFFAVMWMVGVASLMSVLLRRARSAPGPDGVR